jgi:hypothetical protein
MTGSVAACGLLDGRVPRSAGQLELVTDEGIGTMVLPS